MAARVPKGEAIASLEDFPIGRRFITPAVTVTESHVTQFAALTGDWYALHTDAEAAARGPFGERVAHGPLTFALAVGLMYQTQAYGDSILAWLGADELRALVPVRFGDTIHVEAVVRSARPSRQEGRGVVTLGYFVLNQRGESVMTFDFSLLVRSKKPAPAA